MKTGLFLTSACSLGAAALAWTPSSSLSASASASSRRSFLDTAAKIVPLVIVAAPAFAEDEAPAAVEVAVVPDAAASVSTATEASSPTTAATAAVEVEVSADATTTATTESDDSTTTTTPPAGGEENEFIARLRAQSEANRDKYKAQAESNDKLSKRQFLSQYDRPSYVGVHSADNSVVTMVPKPEFERLAADGKVVQTYESKISKKTGESTEDFSRPFYIYTN